MAALLWSLANAAPAVMSAGSTESDAFANLHRKARSHVAKGELYRALDIEKQAMRAQPDNFLGPAYLSWIHWNVKEVEPAIKAGRVAVKLNPGSFLAHYNLAAMLQQAGYSKEALKEYAQAASLDASSWKAQMGMAQCLALEGRTVEAVKHLGIIESRAGSNAELLLLIGDSYLQLESFAKAKTTLARAMALNAGSNRNRELLFQAAIALGDLYLARSLAPRLLAQGTKSADIYMDIATALPDARNPSNARQVLDAASRNIPSSLDVFEQFSRLYLERALKSDEHKSQWLELAEDAARAGMESRSPSSNSRLLLAAALDASGKFKDAGAELDRLCLADRKNALAFFLRSKYRSHDNDVAGAAKRSFKSMMGSSESERAGGVEVSLTSARFRFDKLKCGCHVPVMETKWRKTAGVVFAHIPNVNTPTGVVAYAGDAGIIARLEAAVKGLSERMTLLETAELSGLPKIVLLATEPAAKPKAPLVVRLAAPAPVGP